MTTPSFDPLLTTPYVSVPEFQASPTWLDLNDLIEGGTILQQEDELYNQLLKASTWADNYKGLMPFRAHYQVENKQCRVDKLGRIWIHPNHVPVRQIVAISYSSDNINWTSVETFGPTGNTQAWVEDDRGIVIALSGVNMAFAGPLQFGSVARPFSRLYVQIEYVAGYGHGAITATASNSGATVTLDSVLGFQAPQTTFAGTAYNASVARIWDPALEEAAIVSSVNAGTNTLTFSRNLTNTHTFTTTTMAPNVSEIPAEVKQAIVQYAAALLLRQDAGEALPFAGAPRQPYAQSANSVTAVGGLVAQAEKCLDPYKRVR